MKVAFLFPGQGAQRVGMGAELAREFSVAREAFNEADEALGFKLSKLCFEGPEEDLRLTANTQPATLATSIAGGCSCLLEHDAVHVAIVTRTVNAPASLDMYPAIIGARSRFQAAVEATAATSPGALFSRPALRHLRISSLRAM